MAKHFTPNQRVRYEGSGPYRGYCGTVVEPDVGGWVKVQFLGGERLCDPRQVVREK